MSSSDVIVRQAIEWRERGQHERARLLLTTAIEVDPVNPELLIELANCFPEALGIDRAETAARSATQYSPYSAAAWSALGRVLQEKPDLEEAAECFRRALSIESTVPRLILLAATLFDMGQDARSRELAEEAVKLEPDNDEALYLLGQTLDREDPAAAGSLYERAVRACPQNHYALTALATVLLRQGGSEDRAVELLKQATVAEPSYTWAWAYLGRVYEGQGQRESAIHAYTQAAADPKNDVVRKYLDELQG